MKKYYLLVLNCICMLACTGAVYQKMEERASVMQEETVGETIEETEQELKEPEEIAEEDMVTEAAAEVIVEGRYPIMGTSGVTLNQMVSYYTQSGADYPGEILAEGGAPDIETFCQIYIEEAKREGVRSEVAFAQTMKETGWLQYGGDAKITQFNFAGLGTTGNGVQGHCFSDVREGVRAQIQHLKAYASDQELLSECVDSRYSYVTKGCAPYVEWLGQQENPEGYGWATGANYGYDIVKMINAMKNI